MLLLQKEELDLYFARCGFNVQYQKETEQWIHVFHVRNHEIPLFFKIGPEQISLQMIVFFPIRGLTNNTVTDTSRFLHFLNNDLDLPGFGMSEENDILYYRLVIPSHEGRVNEYFIQTYCEVIKTVMETFFSTIVQVASGKIPFKFFLEKKQATQKNILKKDLL